MSSLPAASAARPRVPGGETAAVSDDDFQDHLLQGVSRTFALTIPQLPLALARTVGNAYLLCRIVDTIEDEPELDAITKRQFCEQFVGVVAGAVAPEDFAAALHPRLSERTLPAERELIANTALVMRINAGFTAPQRDAIETCVRIMAEGMADFQDNRSAQGLERLVNLDRYCYHVAGVVGEMLTRLFCEYSPEIARRREELMSLSVSFGQGLQMTNILKDVWDDRERGACWLPREVFEASGFDLARLHPDRFEAGFGEGLGRLIGVAHGHLKDALTYTLLIPAQETGIRNFCLWALGMAVLTLRKINRHRDFRSGGEVKISRRSVKATIVATRLTVSNDRMLRSLFQFAARGLPPCPTSARASGVAAGARRG